MKHIRVCHGRVCREGSSEKTMDKLSYHYKTAPGAKTDTADLDYCGCMDNCDYGPNVIADNKRYSKAKPETIVERIELGNGTVLSEIDIDTILADDELFEF